ncbi:hypothetical protein [Lacipirellula parvula]|uniref:Uncharacterized protein n=1 Tax=Lacipirellula parvula TaxID=2650471 RepID=A0A5K7XP19_9BACT|nr:hypothetical protein [Lacipirellula parvula]BBO35039.1 hypothetical protein PLANPX_4651 [Lacipirellula parvula]
MRRSALHRLMLRCVALLAIVVMGGVQPMLSACTCGFSVPQSFAEEAVELETSCCSSCCSTESKDDAAAATCCSLGETGANCDDCDCCVSADNSPLPASSTTTVQADDSQQPLADLASSAIVAHAGLNGSAWHNAFDLASSGGVPGVRLHALLSVWRN